ncbi:MAG: dipeptidase, partial [Verrucomicrobiales bacterium]
DEIPADAPIGYILSLEGADSILTPAHLERCWNDGLRALGPAHYGEGRYAFGHDVSGPIKPEGRELLREMDRLGIILDATHLCDESFYQALEIFEGPVWASHSNCRALVPDPRQFSDQQILALIERGAVIGVVFDIWMMVPGFVRGKTTPEEAGTKLAHLIDHIEHICQLAGNARHVGIGSDLDGGFGKEQCPLDLETIADVAILADLLHERGFSKADVEGIMSGNFVRFIRNAWV